MKSPLKDEDADNFELCSRKRAKVDDIDDFRFPASDGACPESSSSSTTRPRQSSLPPTPQSPIRRRVNFTLARREKTCHHKIRNAQLVCPQVTIASSSNSSVSSSELDTDIKFTFATNGPTYSFSPMEYAVSNTLQYHDIFPPFATHFSSNDPASEPAPSYDDAMLLHPFQAMKLE
ncbi:hypothetical protein ARMGADRAFT_1025471 [Armillaria gallica]|uniref:Uncharacterized protein n=1 Tax=Armillaria gallica TaxID=47427 RepID=A0A2H3DVF4_ARMGA|nr:hypothetical protein ARMGADRAFT_1025471 [Armillaria gallica]